MDDACAYRLDVRRREAIFGIIMMMACDTCMGIEAAGLPGTT